MKKIIPAGLLIGILLASFAVFVPAHAYACTTNAECGSGETCNLNGQCVTNTLAGDGGGSGGQLGSDISDLINFANDYLVPLIFGVAFIVFLWGVVQYFIIGGGNEEKREQGRSFIIYGILGFVIMVSIWGIVTLFQNSFGFTSTNAPALPTFNNS